MPVSNNFRRMMAQVPTARVITSNNNTFKQAMNGPDADGFRDVMNSEMGTLNIMSLWLVLKGTEWVFTLGLTWPFKFKC
eukprot:15366831-Ditylum_brightwellii.AAC.1